MPAARRLILAADVCQAEANVKYWEAVAARKWGEQTKVE